MVGEKFGKGICFIFVLIGSKCRSWTWHPLFIILSRFGKSICLSFDLITRSFHVSSLSQCYQIIGRVIHMFKSCLSETSIWVGHLQLSFHFVSAFPVSKVQFPYTLFHLQTLLLISCYWWEIHQGHPMMSLVLSTSAHYPESRLRNYLVPWSLHASMASFSLSTVGLHHWPPNREIMSSVQHQLIYSQSMDCTIVPWESLTSMVISLTLVNGIHQWPVIKWFLPCSTSTHVITWSDSYFGWWDWRPWILSLRSRLWWSMYLWHIDPLCMFRGYVILIKICRTDPQCIQVAVLYYDCMDP